MGLSGQGINVRSPFTVTNKEPRFLALEQLRGIGVEPGAYLLEPVAKNTALVFLLVEKSAIGQLPGRRRYCSS